jgi:galactokinase
MSDYSLSSPTAINDFAQHVVRLRQLPSHTDIELRSLFKPDLPIRVARAPGRLDIMGGIGDYSGSLVLEMPIAEAAFAAVQESPDGDIRIASLSQDESDNSRFVVIAEEQIARFLQADYQTVRSELCRDPDSVWVGYVLGPILVLLKETGAKLRSGLRILIDSQVPEGKGVSSSAAVEVATMRAAAALLQIEVPSEELARLCQLAENHVVGAPCGIMDQMTSALGREQTLLALRCQPANVEGFVEIPKDIAFWGIDSGIRHAVSGSDYSSVRCGAFMGYRIVADAAGFTAGRAGDKSETWVVDDPRWQGYLANISPDGFRRHYAHVVPEKMSGREFLNRFGGTTDRVTRVDPDRRYDILHPTLHPIEENARAERFGSLLKLPRTSQSLAELGQLMASAHDSYSACGLGSEGTDLLVKLARENGPDCGLYGAKITGGGSGGSVAILGRANAGAAVDRISQQYTAVTGRLAYVFRGSSPGAYGTPVAEVII